MIEWAKKTISRYCLFKAEKNWKRQIVQTGQIDEAAKRV
jgi:hypothetical protein